MRWKLALGALVLITTMSLALSELAGPLGSVALLAAGVGTGWLLIPKFWTGLLHGVIGGIVAGLLVLGPGHRLGMRVVAVLDPVRTPEFTWEGTIFIIVMVGIILGGSFGIVGNVARKGFAIPGRIAGLVPAFLVMLMIGESTDEILELGVGPWLNIPMFGAVALAFGALWSKVVASIERRRQPMELPGEPLEVPV